MITNRIINLISRIRNTKDGFIISNKEIRQSNEIIELLAKLGELGYIIYSPQTLSWYKNQDIVWDIRPLSTSGRRLYRTWKTIGEGEIIVRTSQGYKTREEAMGLRQGGELILKITGGAPHQVVVSITQG